MHFLCTVLSEYGKFPDLRLNRPPVIHVTSTPRNSKGVVLDCLPKEVRLLTTGRTERTGWSKAGPVTEAGATRALTALLTCAMAFSMMQLFLLGALGPRLVADLGVSPTVLGLTTTVGFATAAVLSRPAAGWSTGWGPGAAWWPCSP
ncbi:hypothetical protein SHKM778_42370 [Streptomyces sp. KM77-8]|uniref:MFS transporter n=1 Tax=Streptomyces haneummycinicus TaxID=3074435 RepID=A0AAT9HJZ6_9ACTN